jgi:FkbM family methyltransferase
MNLKNKNLIKKIFPKGLLKFIKKRLVHEEIQKWADNSMINSYSEFQEDLIIDSYFKGKTDGTYIDIGAYDPLVISNTRKFYEKNWRGINIDPNMATIELFNQHRPKDINLNIGISDKEEELTFYELTPKALSTFNHADARQNCKNYLNSKIVNTYPVRCIPLKKLFEQYNSHVDLLSIDVEGYEEFVLKSNDWERYRPKMIVIEINRNTDFLLNFLAEQDYRKIFNNHVNAIFIDARV